MKKVIYEITSEDVKIEKGDFFDYFVNSLSKDPEQLESYKKHIVSEYDKTKDIALFLEGLKIVARAEEKMPSPVKAAKEKKANVYKKLLKEDVSTFDTVISAAQTLGYKISISI
jgi:DNA-binding phage protein